MAGKERRNAAKITPLMPQNAPTGSKAAATWARTEAPPTSQCSSTQMTIPAGAATEMARAVIFAVRSSSDRRRIRPTLGFRKGGISSTIWDDCFRTAVLLRTAEARSVIQTLNRTKAVRIPAAKKPFWEKNRLMSTIIAGNLPLQGTKALVRMAMSRSRGEAIIRHPVTPAALQPKPMAMVSTCLPQPPHLAKL